MCQQSLDSRILDRQLGFSEQRVHLAMANTMQVLGLPPAFTLGNQVVRITLFGWDLALAQRTDHNLLNPNIHSVYTMD